MVHDNHASPRDARPVSVDRAEERAWIGFYERVDRDPALAIEIMALLDSDPDSKRRHLALYLSCKQSVRFHKAREARDRRIGELVRQVFHALVVQPLAALRTFAERFADFLSACAPAGRSAVRGAARAAARPTDAPVSNAGRTVRRLPRGSGDIERDGPPEPPAREADQQRTQALPEVAPAVALRR